MDDPATWDTFETALAAYRASNAAGIGVVLTRGDPFVGIDFDHCRNPETGAVEAGVAAQVARLDSYAEVSPGRAGLHVLVRGALPGGGRRRGHIEMYDRDRFFCVTGTHLPGTPTTIEARQATLEDERVLVPARMASNGTRFSRLFDDGDTSGYASPSEADLALCGMLAYWTGRDAARVDRIFRQSRLMRAKWDERRGEMTYGERTVVKALDGAAGTLPDPDE